MPKFQQLSKIASQNGQVTGSAAADTNSNGPVSTSNLFKLISIPNRQSTVQIIANLQVLGKSLLQQNLMQNLKPRTMKFYDTEEVEKFKQEFKGLLSQRDTEIQDLKESIDKSKKDDNKLKNMLHKLIQNHDAVESTDEFVDQNHIDIYEMFKSMSQKVSESDAKFQKQLQLNQTQQVTINEKSKYLHSETTLKESFKEQVLSLQLDKSKLSDQISKLQIEIALKKQDYEQSQLTNQNLANDHQKEIEKLKEEIKVQAQSLDKSNKELDSNKKEILMLETTNTQLNKQLTQLNTKREELEKEQSQLLISKSDLQNQNVYLSLDLQKANNLIEKLEQELKQKADELTHTQKELGDFKDQLEKLQKAVSSVTQRIASFKKEVPETIKKSSTTKQIHQIDILGYRFINLLTSFDELKKEKSNLEAKHNQTLTLLDKSKNDKGSLQKKLEESIDQERKLAKEKESLNQQYIDLQKDKDQISSKLAGTEIQLKNFKNDVSRLESKVQEMTLKVQEGENKHDQLVQKSKDEALKWKEVETKLKEDIDELKRNLATSKSETQMQKQHYENEMRVHKYTKQILDKLTADKKDLDQKLLESVDQITKLQKSLDKVKKQLADKNNQYQTLDEKHQGTLNELQRVNANLKDKIKDYDDLSIIHQKTLVELEKEQEATRKIDDLLFNEKEQNRVNQTRFEDMISKLNQDLQKLTKDSSIRITNTEYELKQSQNEVRQQQEQIIELQNTNQKQEHVHTMKFQELQNNFDALEQQSKTVENKLAKEVEDHNSNKQKLNKAFTENKELKYKLKKIDKTLASKTKEHAHLATKHHGTQIELRKVQEAKDQVDIQLKDVSETRKSIQEQLLEKSTKLSSLEEQHKQEKKDHQQTNDKLNKKQNALIETQEELKKEKKEHQKTNKKLKTVEDEKTQVENEFTQEKESLRQTQENLQQTQENLSQTKQSLKNTEDVLHDETTRHNKTQKNLDLKIKNVIEKIFEKQKLNMKHNKLQAVLNEKIEMLQVQLKDSESNSQKLQETLKALQEQFKEMKPMNMTQVSIPRLECNYNKDEILKSNKNNLFFLIQTVQEAIQGLHMIKGKNIVITLGNTGAGKSTLLNSIVFGSDKLEFVKAEKSNKLVIDQKASLKNICQLKIGHKSASSQTFRPEIIYSEEFECFFIDIAGFNDSHGPYFDLINCFVLKYLFENAKSIKFICPLTHVELHEQKGKAVNDLVNQLQLMCKGHLLTLVDSIIPVITKCKPNSQEDIDCEQLNADICETMSEHFNIIQEQDSSIDYSIKSTNELHKEDDIKFINDFSFKTVIVDALDREIKNLSDEVQSTSLTDFKKLIKDSKSTDPVNLNTPLTQQTLFHLNKLIDQSFKRLYEVAAKHIEEAKQQGDKFDKKIEESHEYINLKKCLQFLDELVLLTGSQYQLERLNSYVKNWNELIEQAKLFKNMGTLDREQLVICHELCLHHNNKDAKKMAMTFVKVLKHVNKLKQTMNNDQIDMTQSAKLSNIKAKLENQVENYITEYCQKDKDMFYSLCSELLILESNQQNHVVVDHVLRGQVKPDILREIICSNKYDAKTQKIVPKPGKFFRICVGTDSSILQYNPKNSNSQESLIISNEQIKDYNDKFQFQLTKHKGFLLLCGGNIIGTEEKVTQLLDQKLIINTNSSQSDKQNLWQFSPQNNESAKQDLPYLFIQQQHDGVQAPRLINKKSNSGQKDLPWVTAKGGQQYNDEELAIWKVFKAE